MDMQIYFPQRGIYLEHGGKTLTVFGFDIAYYGNVIVTGMLIGVAIAMHEAKRTGQNPDQYIDLAMIGIAAGIRRIYGQSFRDAASGFRGASERDHPGNVGSSCDH